MTGRYRKPPLDARPSFIERGSTVRVRQTTCKSRANAAFVLRGTSPAREGDWGSPSVTCYGVYSSALATGSLPHPLGVQLASLAPPTLRTCLLGSRARAAPPMRP